MNSKKVWPAVALLLGLVTTIIGAAFIITYVLEAVVARVGEPDQSLLFWYLPLLFFGFIGLVIGVSGIFWGFYRLRQFKRGKMPHDQAPKI